MKVPGGERFMWEVCEGFCKRYPGKGGFCGKHLEVCKGYLGERLYDIVGVSVGST